MKPITEESDRPTIDGWYAEAKKQTLDSINLFIRSLGMDYEHDYGTICHAIAAAAVGAMHAVNHSSQGGITGFQAGAIQWEVIKAWGAIGTPGAPMRLVDYSHMLYPQYGEQFNKCISADTWNYLRKEAAKHLAEAPEAHPDVVSHWQSIVDGVIPFGYRIGEE